MSKIIMVMNLKHEIDLSKYNIRTDLMIENSNNGIIKDSNELYKITLTNIDKEQVSTNKKRGKYITLEFNDISDSDNFINIEGVLTKILKDFLKKYLKNNSNILIIGLGNEASTPDSLGPKTVNLINVTRHIYLLDKLDPKYRIISAFKPGVMGNTGIETYDIIKSIKDSIKPDIIIIIDALASKSIERVNKTIQISDTGINPGSGIGNNRKEISFDTLKVPVISIGVPTVVDAVSVVADTINYMHKNYAFNKKYINNPINRLISSTKINYLKENIQLNKDDKSYLLGLVGTLSENEIRELLYEVLTPIGYNLIVTPKEIDFEIKKLSELIANSLNKSLNIY